MSHMSMPEHPPAPMRRDHSAFVRMYTAAVEARQAERKAGVKKRKHDESDVKQCMRDAHYRLSGFCQHGTQRKVRGRAI